MIYIIITTCLVVDKFEQIRKLQYLCCINNIIKLFDNINNKKIIIVENNNNDNSYLDNFGVDVLYTKNNLINYNNKGLKEYNDILECINKYNINDEDLIVKITGRYIVKKDSNFLKELTKISNDDNNNIECIIRYGNYDNIEKDNKDDCITGMICMKCKYVKTIQIKEDEIIEYEWAKASLNIKKENILELRDLGLILCPSTYFYDKEL